MQVEVCRGKDTDSSDLLGNASEKEINGLIEEWVCDKTSIQKC